jgi:hypothetical protein
MPEAVMTGQSWSAWVPARQQWLQATVIHHGATQATLKFDSGYGLSRGEDEQSADRDTMLSNCNLFRFIEAKTV